MSCFVSLRDRCLVGLTQLFKANRPFDLLVFQFWSIFRHGPKRLTFSSRSFGQLSEGSLSGWLKGQEATTQFGAWPISHTRLPMTSSPGGNLYMSR